METVVATHDLTKLYGKARGALAVNLGVRRGEVFGFLGPNGAGKTTTIRVLLDLIRPTSGSAEILGQDSRTFSRDIRRRIGYLPGEYAVYDDMTGLEYLHYLDNLRGNGSWQRTEVLAQRLRASLRQPMKSLSLGNKRKLGLIQATMHAPELLILDEPTSGLDPLIQQEFYALMDEWRAAGRTVFLSSHNLPEVERVCDRVAIIREGRIVAVEDVAALKQRSLRRLEVRFAAAVPAEAFVDVPGVRDVTVSGPVLHCAVAGTMDPLIKALGAYEVETVISHEPSLEEIFLAYYNGGPIVTSETAPTAGLVLSR